MYECIRSRAIARDSYVSQELFNTDLPLQRGSTPTQVLLAASSSSNRGYVPAICDDCVTYNTFCKKSVLENLAAAAASFIGTATVQTFVLRSAIVLACSVKTTIHSLKKQKVAPIW